MLKKVKYPCKVLHVLLLLEVNKYFNIDCGAFLAVYKQELKRIIFKYTINTYK